MEINQFKQSVKDIGRMVGALVEAKLGDRAQIEEQVRTVAKQVERVVSEALWNRNGYQNVSLKFKKLPHFKGELPAYATPGSSGLDVRACLESPMVIEPGERALIPTGLSTEFPHGFEIQVRPRSGLAISKGLSMVNTPGTVDADYRGEIKIIAINHGQEPITINDQDRVAQFVLCPVIQAEISEVEELEESERGEGGFGSTGV